MLENTFCHIRGISNNTEKKLWNSQIYNWETFLKNNTTVSGKRYISACDSILKSYQYLEKGDHRYFYTSLPSKEQWRIFRLFQHRAVYLDIETTGLSFNYDEITTIALYDGKKIKWYVNGKNLNEFKKDIKQYELIISYNGKCFDVPFLQNTFNIELNHSHIDLRYVLSSLGYSGGLKNCEKDFGIKRKDMPDIDGWFAVQLWKEYKKTSNENVLHSLLAYNIEDVINLEKLMFSCFNLKLEDTPFKNVYELKIPPRPLNPFTVDKNVVKTIKNKYGYI